MPPDKITDEQYRAAARRTILSAPASRVTVPVYAAVHPVADGGAYVEVSLFVQADEARKEPASG